MSSANELVPASSSLDANATSGSLSREASTALRSRSSTIVLPELQSPVADLLARQTIPAQSLGDLYFDLGKKLFHIGAYIQAADAFQQAVVDVADQSATVAILFYQALAYEKGGQKDRAFRSYLDAVLQAPEYIDSVLPYLHQLLSQDIALVQQTWLTEEWQKRLEAMSLSSLNRAHSALLLCHVQMYLADYKRVRTYFEEAMRLAPDVVPSLVGTLLTSTGSPLALNSVNKDNDAHYVLAQILEATGAREEAATTYYDLAVSFHGREEYERAIEMLRHSAQLRPTHVPTCWYWADALLGLSYREQKPDAQLALVKEGIAQWDSGFKSGTPDTQFAWAYVTRAFLCAAHATLSDSMISTRVWEAIASLEQAMLLERKDVYTWASLGRFHRFVNNEQNALEATRIAMELADKSSRSYALSERAAILANVGNFTEAEKAIDELREREPTTWADLVKAVVDFYQGHIDHSIELLDAVLQKEAQNMWALSLRAFCYRKLGKTALANQDYDEILKIYTPPNVSDQEYYAWAEYMRGDPRKALAIYEEMLKDPAQNVHFTVGLCYVKLREIETGKKYMLEGIRRTTNTRQLANLGLDLDHITDFASTWPQDERERIRKVLASVQKAAGEQRSKLQHSRSCEEELLQTFKQYPHKSEAGMWAWMGARASLARLYTEQQRWLEAVEMYRLLLKEGRKFAEARLGLEKVADALCERADEYIESGSFQEALECYTQAQTFIPVLLSKDATCSGDLYTRLGYTHFALADSEQARTYFVAALQSYRQGKIAAPGEALGDMCRALLQDAGQYWALDAEWRNWLTSSAIDEQLRADLTSALPVLAQFLNEHFKLLAQAKDEAKQGTTLPIVLEFGSGLLPAATSTEQPLFKSYLPGMRQNIKRAIGVEALYVQIRDNSGLAPDEYRILLDEIPVAKNSVPLDRRYTPGSPEQLQAIGIPQEALIAALNPLTGIAGCWIGPEHYQSVREHGLELWEEPLIYIVHHLETMLRNNLAWFLGIQEVERLLQTWEGEEQNPSWVVTALSDKNIRFYFARVLRALVREQVPIHSWKDILATLRQPELVHAGGNEVLRAVRLKLKQWLPGNTPMLPRFEIPLDLEEQLIEGLRLAQKNESFNLYYTALNAFFELIQKKARVEGWQFAVVVHHPDFRLFVRSCLEPVYPYLAVLSQQELLSHPDEEQIVTMNVTEAQVEGVKADAE